MAEKKTTTTTTKSTARTTTRLLDELGFWAVIALALVMFINAFLLFLNKVGVDFKSLAQASSILNKIAMAIAIGITLWSSYFAARHKKKNLFIVWLVSSILVGLSFILGIALI